MHKDGAWLSSLEYAPNKGTEKYHGTKNGIINVKENKQFNFVQTVRCHSEVFLKIKVG